MKHVSLTALVVSLLAAAPAASQNACASRDQVLTRLSEKYGETRQSIGLAQNSGVFEVFASHETGSWTILMTRPDGVTCLVASGQAFEQQAELAVVTGDDA